MNDTAHLDRIEAAIESFRAAVRGAIEVHRPHDLACSVDTHEKSIGELKNAVALIVREWQAYIRCVPPQ